MKNNNLVSILFLVVPLVVIFGQSNIFPSAGNVGIGTTSPGARLEVKGQVIGGFGAQTTAGAQDWNDITNTRSGSGYTLLNGNDLNGPVDAVHYFHTFNFEYGGNKNGTGNMTQLAVPYGHGSSINQGMFFRGRYANNWSPWRKIISEEENGNVGIGVANPLAKLHVNNGDNSYGSILANATESNFSFYTKTLSTNVYQESFRMGLKYASNENNGFISFYRGGGVSGGFLGFSTNGIERMSIKDNGNVGIGTSTPGSIFDITSASNNRTWLNYNDKSAISFIPNNTNSWFHIGHGLDDTLYISHGGTVGAVKIMAIHNSGNIGLGTNTPDEKLTVKGKIHAQEVKIDLQGAVAPDYVFEKDYNLKSLNEVENYINTYKHLPEIPSAKEMEQQGLFLKQMNLKLLQKIEELTLYTIHQEKELEKQKERNQNLEERLLKIEQLLTNNQKNK